MKTSDRQMILPKKINNGCNERSFHINEEGGIWKCRKKKTATVYNGLGKKGIYF